MKVQNRQRIFKIFVTFAGLLLMGSLGFHQPLAPTTQAQEAAVKVIFDTDLGIDEDDCGALAVLHKLADYGEVEIIAMGTSSNGNGSDSQGVLGAQCIDAINTFYGRPDIPIGRGPDDAPTKPNDYLNTDHCLNMDNFPRDLVGVPPTAVEVYRQALSEQSPDDNVKLITVGFLGNVRDLLQSEPDQYSPLNGEELVSLMVDEWVAMGGQYPAGREYNFDQHPSATDYAIEHWPGRIVFSGGEIGDGIITGGGHGPILDCYNSATGSRPSWDQTAVLAAVRDPSLYWGMVTTGYNDVKTSGFNGWRSSPDLDHNYLTQDASDSFMTELIQGLMDEPPSLDTTPVPTPED